MFHFSPRQYLLLGIGFALILLSVTLDRVTDQWNATFHDKTVAWHHLAISPGANTYVSSLDDSMLVLRSSSHSDARLTLLYRVTVWGWSFCAGSAMLAPKAIKFLQ